ncbi:unnamed protein product [Trichogramma brassicae]|uniref:Uncharacterized protein n=1 Tax=Trichogramma brassicae TaxID=86971 RepID=A0A6H5I3C8_9HYME|nr:unnamed protein product [Trichogramma brassicae]
MTRVRDRDMEFLSINTERGGIFAAPATRVQTVSAAKPLVFPVQPEIYQPISQVPVGVFADESCANVVAPLNLQPPTNHQVEMSNLEVLSQAPPDLGPLELEPQQQQQRFETVTIHAEGLEPITIQPEAYLDATSLQHISSQPYAESDEQHRAIIGQESFSSLEQPLSIEEPMDLNLEDERFNSILMMLNDPDLAGSSNDSLDLDGIPLTYSDELPALTSSLATTGGLAEPTDDWDGSIEKMIAPKDAPKSSWPKKKTEKRRRARPRTETSNRARLVAAKMAKDRGEAYTTLRGKPMPKRELREPCKSNCRIRCYKCFDRTLREALFRQFWALADHKAQWDYIANHIVVLPKMQCVTQSGSSKREKSRYYFLEKDHKHLRVCKTMFLNTLGINDQWVVTVSKKLDKNGQVSQDGRGKIGHRRKKEPDDPS